MDETEAAELSPADEADKRYLTVRQAAFIGVGAMVDAGFVAVLLSVALDYGWKHFQAGRTKNVQLAR
jgi:hypothetical protein